MRSMVPMPSTTLIAMDGRISRNFAGDPIRFSIPLSPATTMPMYVVGRVRDATTADTGFALRIDPPADAVAYGAGCPSPAPLSLSAPGAPVLGDEGHAPGDGLDPSCGQVVLELIARGILVSLVSAGGGQLGQGEYRLIGEEDFEVEGRHQGSILWTVGVES